MNTRYLVSTTMGDSILGLENRAYVQVSSRSYIRKRVSDLNIGDMVLFQKPYASTDIDDVDPYLVRSPRYARAKDLLHEVNFEGLHLPKLRTFLLRGMAEHGVVSQENLEAKVLCEGDDFTSQEYSVMEEYLSNTLQENGFSRSDAALNNWLKGETISPSEWDIFRALENINPEFSQFEKYDQDSKSMYFNYQLYTGIRKGIMRYLNFCRGTQGPSKESNHKEDPHISLSPEYAIVFQHFMNDRTETHATARITGIEKILKRRHLESVKERREHLLGDGIVKEELNYLRGSLKDYNGVLEATEILEGFLSSFVEDFDYSIYDDSLNLPRLDRVNAFSYLYPRIFEYFGEGGNNFSSFLREFMYEDFVQAVFPNLNLFTEKTMRALLERNMDEFFNYPTGTSLKLLESFYSVFTTLPNKYFDYRVKCQRLKRFLGRRGEAKSIQDGLANSLLGEIPKTYDFYLIPSMFDGEILNKLKELDLVSDCRKIKKDYDINLSLGGSHYDGGLFLSDGISDFTSIRKNPFEGSFSKFSLIPKEISGREFIEQNMDKNYRDSKLMNNLLGKEVYPRTRAHTLSVLDEFNLGHIVDRRWQDFVWENL